MSKDEVYILEDCGSITLLDNGASLTILTPGKIAERAISASNFFSDMYENIFSLMS